MATDIEYSVSPDEVEFYMQPYTGYEGKEFPGKWIFTAEDALALLLINGVIHINNHYWEKDWPEKARATTFLGVQCSDVFMWGCSDSEEIDVRKDPDELHTLYLMWRLDPTWAAAAWCIAKRKQKPGPWDEKSIREDGVWDLDKLVAGEFPSLDDLRERIQVAEAKAREKSQVDFLLNCNAQMDGDVFRAFFGMNPTNRPEKK